MILELKIHIFLSFYLCDNGLDIILGGYPSFRVPIDTSRQLPVRGTIIISRTSKEASKQLPSSFSCSLSYKPTTQTQKPHRNTTSSPRLRTPISRHRKVLRPLIHLMPKDIIPHHRHTVRCDFVHGRVCHLVVYPPHNQQCSAPVRLLGPFEGDTWSCCVVVLLIVVGIISVPAPAPVTWTWTCRTERLRNAG